MTENTTYIEKYKIPRALTSNLPPYEHNDSAKIIYCLNCNKKGHIYKKCRAPSNSYGIIVFKKFWGLRMKFLMIQRKYSHSFIDIIMGRFYIDSTDRIDFFKLSKMVKYLTITERHIIRRFPFKFLWNKMWTWNIAELNQRYFDYLCRYNKSIDYVIQLFGEIQPVLQQPEWEFPKGKRSLGESDINCAIRECFEETTLERKDYYIYPNLRHFQDKFQGTDGNEYANNYYLAELIEYGRETSNLIYYDCTNFDQCSEIKKIGWFTIDEINDKLEDNFPTRLAMIKHINTLITCWQSNNKYNKIYTESLI